MGKKAKPKNKVPSKRWEKYKVVGDNVERALSCPKCGPGTFFAQHEDRMYCGRCHYVEMKKQK